MNQLAPLLHVEPYGYAGAAPAPTPLAESCEDWPLLEVDAEGKPVFSEKEGSHSDATLLNEQFGARIAEETRRSYESGYARGREDSLGAAREAQQAAHAEQLRTIATAVESMTETFASERARYYERLEQEAVRLALAIAGRILRREAQMDPLFLLGAVRVALGQLTTSTKVRLRVPASDAELWIEAMTLLPNRDTKPEVIAAEDLRTGECLMETELGSADLGVRVQMTEIERSLLDRNSGTIHSDSELMVSPL
ncbi:FliH/SctL family protein [Occallatibacter riparius]|uniref:Flagellar assembly protein FliH n=1 Tax=Occallatibacter riparius TaxID=1002689 RepID=A0A9J7BKL6_9BACT|nr:FliH/SctL family protein [Occallatibacter riparius]UWZ83139.1 hypothetical protein MOP44_21530 [Occallatibacter riparius]